MIRFEIDKASSLDLLTAVLREIRFGRGKTVDVETVLGTYPGASPQHFRITYVGPSRRSTGTRVRRPSMTGKQSRSK